MEQKERPAEQEAETNTQQEAPDGIWSNMVACMRFYLFFFFLFWLLVTLLL